jgi:signal transduction histidine kinase
VRGAWISSRGGKDWAWAPVAISSAAARAIANAFLEVMLATFSFRLRLNRILSDFLKFARPQEARVAPGDIRDVLEHVSGLIRDDRSRAGRVDVRVAVESGLPRFAFDRDQLIQVVWNLALNGVEAMNGRGRLSLEGACHNGAVALAVTDTGLEIPAERRRRVFEPFYSGKPNGTGLGLTIAERIVAAHGGRIEIDSEPGRGTRVTLLFPVEGG